MSLIDTIEADIDHLVDTENGFGELIQRADLTTFNAIVYDGIDEVEDPRAPVLGCKASDIAAHGETLVRVKTGVSYTVEGYQPGPDGFCLVQTAPVPG